jgi:D-isomer specific 2-hydroxyacid dehydrogenase, NAD binding domain
MKRFHRNYSDLIRERLARHSVVLGATRGVGSDPSQSYLSETNKERAALVVDADLIAAAESGTIAGAVLDVFRVEPLPADHPFFGARKRRGAPPRRRRASAAGQIRVRVVR